MILKDFIKDLDKKPDKQRLSLIIDWLISSSIPFTKNEYRSGTNLIVDIGESNKRIGISSHFDKYPGSGGANDNGSAIAVCVDIIRKFSNFPIKNSGIRIFFFDQEESGLKGSSAYVEDHGVNSLNGLFNMELTGFGNKFALWPVSNNDKGTLINCFESVALEKKIDTFRFDRIITNTADHSSFQKGGLRDAFTITCISEKDLEIAHEYYRAIEAGVYENDLIKIFLKSPLFSHYHKPTDTYEKLSEETLQMTSETILSAIFKYYEL